LIAQIDQPVRAGEEPTEKRKTPPSVSSASTVSSGAEAPDEIRKARSARAKRWRAQFESGRVTEATIEELVADLVKSKQYEEVIACLEQAIIGGKIIAPWMHEALALAMQSAGRPKTEIERVLMSNQDLIGGDAESMMKLATYLTRFERYDRAIELYRQAAYLSPDQPEPFILALDLARRTGNADAVVWSAPEVLAYAWGKEREPLRRGAEQAVADAIPQLTKEGKVSKALQLQESVRKARELDLVVRLEWNGQGDVDLLVEEPSGSVCSMSKPFTPAGGAFVHDGYGPNQANCYDEYVCPSAIPGEYRLIVRHIRGDVVAKRARLIITRGKNTADEETETQTVVLGRTDSIVRMSLGRGRRLTADAVVPLPVKQTRRPGTAGTSVLAQIGRPQVGNIGNAVGGGVVGYQPVITMISEGIAMNALATVSGDRRYVRIRAAPSFSSITDVFTFSFVR
jgi:tetratricopeptide (TPR) repeat protein